MAQTLYVILEQDKDHTGMPQAFRDREAAEEYRAERILESAAKSRPVPVVDWKTDGGQEYLDILCGECDISIQVFETELGDQ